MSHIAGHPIVRHFVLPCRQLDLCARELQEVDGTQIPHGATHFLDAVCQAYYDFQRKGL